MRARTKEPKFLAQVTEPQVFVNALSMNWWWKLLRANELEIE